MVPNWWCRISPNFILHTSVLLNRESVIFVYIICKDGSEHRKTVCSFAIPKMCRSLKRQHISIVDIDPTMEHIPELAESLNVDLQSVMEKLLLALKLTLNEEVKNASPEKRRLLLEYLFPYAVLSDYSDLVRFLMKGETNIPEAVVHKLMTEQEKYKEFLTPVILSNIYKQYSIYLDESVQKVISSYIHQPSSFGMVASRCLCKGNKSFEEYFASSV